MYPPSYCILLPSWHKVFLFEAIAITAYIVVTGNRENLMTNSVPFVSECSKIVRLFAKMMSPFASREFKQLPGGAVHEQESENLTAW